MARSFQERLDVFCADFSSIGHALEMTEAPTELLAREVLPRNPGEEEDEFEFRCGAVVNAYTYVLKHWEAFHNVGYIRVTGSGRWTIEGPLLYSLCLYLAADDSCFESEPELARGDHRRCAGWPSMTNEAKPPNKPPEPTPGSVTPRATVPIMKMKLQTAFLFAARGAPAPVVAHL